MQDLMQHDPPYPGEILFEFYLEPLGLSITEAAKRLLISRPNLSAIINGRAGVSPLMALKLSRAFDTSPQYWLNLQTNYDLWVASKNDKMLKGISSLV